MEDDANTLFDHISIGVVVLGLGLFKNLFENVSDSNGLLHNSGVVLVTHAVHVLQRVSKILTLNRGECIFHGTWDELQTFEPKNDLHMAKIEAMRSSLQFGTNNDDEVKSVKEERSDVKTADSSAMVKDTDAQKGEIISTEEQEQVYYKIA